ncbi:MAG: Ig-like domain-containing protein [Candidatus Poribacteria bacterium]|nr:Ig-like domain-containing protein [Candidatus Poribacteria bacterium]
MYYRLRRQSIKYTLYAVWLLNFFEFCLLPAPAQQTFQWRSFTRIHDGLSSNNVRSIAEDSFGQIWLATSSGLSCFNGFWHVIEVSIGDSSSSDINHIFSDIDGFIWVMTSGGVFQGMPRNGGMDWVHHYTTADGLIDNSITAAVRRQNGEIWVGTPSGANWFDGNRWRAAPNAEEGSVNKGVRVVYEDKMGNLWFGLSRPNRPYLVSRFDGAEWEVFRIEDGLPNGDVEAITSDPLNNIWVGTTEGAAIYDGTTWQIITSPELIGNRVQSIKIDVEETVWIGTSVGISLFSRGRWRHLTKGHGLASNNIQTLFESREGGIWVGTRDNGVSFTDRLWRSITTNDGLSDNQVTSMLTDGGGTTWVGTRNGLVRYSGRKIESVEELLGRDIRVLAEDAEDRLWVGTDSGIVVFSPIIADEPSIWRHFRRADGLKNDSVQSLAVDAAGDVWVGTGILLADEPGFFPGLDRFDGDQWHAEEDIFEEFGEIVAVMYSDSRGRLFFGTVGDAASDGELWVYHGGILNRISPNISGSINAIMESSDGSIWIGTSDGILILDGEALQQTNRLTTDDGLVDNRVQALFRDEPDRMWIGTVDGVSLFQTNRFARSITASDGLNSNNISVIIKPADGVLWFGSKDNGGVSHFNQEMIPPTTRIIEGPTNGEIVGDTSVIFKFEGGDLSTPTRELRYQYKLDGNLPMPTDDDGFSNRVSLTGLAEGGHRFIVQAIDREENLDLLGAQAEFIIDSKPPTVLITNPKRGAVIKGVYGIEGSATDMDFHDYEIQISGQSVFTSNQPVDRNTLYRWDTQTVPDGTYNIRLTARDTPNGDYDREHRAEEMISVEVDNTLPGAKIKQPLPEATVSGETEVEIELTDLHLMSYRLEFTRAASKTDTPEEITSGSISDSPLSIVKQVPWNSSTVYGHVMLRAAVADAAGNEGVSEVVPIFLDNEGAKPVVEIHRPNGINPISKETAVTATVGVGTAPDTFIENISLDYRRIDDLQGWKPLRGGRLTLNNEEITRWDTTALPDGEYLLRLSAKDSNGYSSNFERKVFLDNTPPTGIIRFPQDGDVRKAERIDVIGTATDENFEGFELEYSVNGETWILIPGLNTSVESERLGSWNAAALPGGAYLLRLTVVDKAGLETTTEVSVVLDDSDVISLITSPKQDAYVSGQVRITGTANDPNFNRFHLEYRLAGVNGAWRPIPDLFSPDKPKENEPLADWNTPQLDENFEVRLTAFDDSGKSETHIVPVHVDNLKPSAHIIKVQSRHAESQASGILSGEIEIFGEATDVHFKDFRLDFRPTDYSGDWQPIPVLNSTRPRRNTTLAIWRNTPQIDGEYEIRLEVEDKSGKSNPAFMRVEIDNQSPIVEISQPSHRQLVFTTIEIIGTASDKYLEAYQLDFRAEGTAEWQQIIRATHPKEAAVLGEWEPPMVDGGYEIRLRAFDFDGSRQPSESIVQVLVDRLPPQAEIHSPTVNQQLPRRVDILGTADDLNFNGYVIEYSGGQSPDIWRPISKTGFLKPVNEGLLAEWSVPELSSGEYSLRLRVEDGAGHESATSVKVFFRERVERQNNSVVQSEDGIARIVFPPNSLPESTYVTINPVQSANGPSSASSDEMLNGGGSPNVIPRFDTIYNFEPANLQLHRLKPATIEFAVQELTPAMRNEALTISHWDGDRWKPIGGTINERQGTISTVVSGLGQYAVTTAPPVEVDGDVIIADLTCQPRLFSPNKNESTSISFRLNQPSNVTVRIYNEAGRLRRNLRESEQLSTGRHVFWWDGRDDDMRRVVSNFYIVTVEAEGALARKAVIVQNN